MVITSWTHFSKKHNSTQQPVSGQQYDVKLKEPTNVLTPTFKSATMSKDVNYIQAFGRYYYVTDVTYDTNDIAEFHCKVDVLASYKTDIRNTSAYVARAASVLNFRNPDPLNPATVDVEIKHKDILNTGWNTYRYILGTVGKLGVRYYSLTDAQLNAIFNQIFSQNFLDQFTSQMYGLRDCVISLKRVPYIPTGNLENVYIGQFDTQNPGTLVTQTILHDDSTVLLPFPADDHIASLRTYLDFPPYTTGIVYLPYVGVIPLDVDIVGDTRYLKVDMWVDQVTADIVYKLSTTGNQCLGVYQGNCGSDLPIASQNYNPMGVVSSGIATIGGIVAAATMSPLPVPAAIGAAVVGGTQVAKSLELHSQVNGTLSSYISSEIDSMVWAEVITRVPVTWDVEAFKTSNGAPYNKRVTLSNLSGYIQTIGASVAIEGFDSERREVNSLLDSGFFLE